MRQDLSASLSGTVISIAVVRVREIPVIAVIVSPAQRAVCIPDR